MKSKGRLEQAYIDFEDCRLRLTIAVDEADETQVDKLLGKPLTIELKPYKEPRSASANALLWHCIGEIVDAMRDENPLCAVTKQEVYLSLLRDYGKYTSVVLSEEAVEDFKTQWRDCEEVGRSFDGDTTWVTLLCYFGSSTYNSKEFSRLLNGAKTEMVNMGLEPPLSSEMARVIESLERSEQ